MMFARQHEQQSDINDNNLGNGMMTDKARTVQELRDLELLLSAYRTIHATGEEVPLGLRCVVANLRVDIQREINGKV